MIVIATVCLLILIIIFQNTRTVETRLLFMTISMPRALLLFIAFVVGFASGTVFISGFRRKTSKENAKKPSYLI